MDYVDRIAEEAEVLFMKYGIRAVTMDRIAQDLGISKRTIYEHFSDKDTLLLYVIRRKAEKQKEIFHAIMEASSNAIEVIFMIIGTAFDQMRNANPTYMLDLKRYHPDVFRTVCDRGDIRNSEMSLILLKRGVSEELFRDDIIIDLVNEGLHSFIDSSHSSDLMNSSRYSGLEILDNLLINYLRGISTPKGLKLIDKYRKELKTN